MTESTSRSAGEGPRAIAGEMRALRAFAESLAKEAGEIVRECGARRTFEIKPDGTPVTPVDWAVERALRARIDEAYPRHGVLGEEYGSRGLDAEWVWVLDPIDGTRQFAAGLPNFGVLIALCRCKRPVLGVICQPLLDDVYLGISGAGAWWNGEPIRPRATRRLADAVACHSDPDAFVGAAMPGFEALRRAVRWNVYDGGCIGIGALASGYLDICLCGPNLDNFDICALVPVVEGAGGRISDWNGADLSLHSSGTIVACATRELHEQALGMLADAASVPGC